MTYLTGDIPIGNYDTTRLANLGIGHGALGGSGGYTYFNPQTGREFSAATGLTYNFINQALQYQNGIDFHLDWGASQFLSKEFLAGLSATSSTKLPAAAAPARGPAEQLRQQRRGTMTRDLVGRGLTPVTAQAGNLDAGVTTHWLSARELRQAYPKVKMEEDRIFIVEDAVWTSAGRPMPGWVEFSDGSRPRRAPSIKRPEPLTVIV
jgi:hypothetical protein